MMMVLWKDLIQQLQNKYDIVVRTTKNSISFSHPDMKRPVRGEKLGADLLKGKIENAIKYSNENRDRELQQSSTLSNQFQTPRNVQNRQGQMLMEDSDKERIAGAIRSLDNENKKQALMQSELEKAHLSQAKQLEALQNQLQETVFKIERGSEKLSEDLLKSVNQSINALQKQEMDSIVQSKKEYRQIEELIALVQNKVNCLQESNRSIANSIEANLKEWKDSYVGIIREQTKASVQCSLDEVEHRAKQVVSSIEQESKVAESRWNNFNKANEKLQIIADKWSTEFRKKTVSASILAIVSAFILCFAVLLAVNVYQPIKDLQNATSSIETINSNIQAVSSALSEYYETDTGESIQTTRINYYVEKGDWGKVIVLFLQTHWRLIFEVIGGVVLFTYRKNK